VETAAVENLNPVTTEQPRRHPCFYGTCHGAAGRLHLPVSPDCNIRCRFCRRGVDDGQGNGPGLTRGVLPVAKVAETVRRALVLCPELAVVGVAGPGDALAGDQAIEAFKIVRKHFPQLMTCLSTNGLLLPERAQALIDAGVTFLTVTVNAATPETLAELCGGVLLDNTLHTGLAGAEQLLSRQEEGIKLAVKLGATVKINSVLVPGVNSAQIGQIARRTAAWGASRMNIIPLIPQWGMAGRRAPTEGEVADARAQAAEHIEVVTHCARCRADACGVPGVSDYSRWLYGGGPGGVEFSHG